MEIKLDIKDAIALLSGKDFWHTQEFEELNIPVITMSDGPYGLRKQDDEGDHLGIHDSIKAICFPTSTVLASTFDTTKAYEMGRLIGEECLSEGVNIILGPGVNIKRTPVGGRNFEYYSEDPFLTSRIAQAFVKGVESCGVGCCVKHFALNNQENARMTISSNVSDRALHEIYLYAFKHIIKNTELTSIMTSYNRYNGEYVEANKYLLTDLLRNEWGFKGIYISDWYATVDRVKSLEAGVDLEMPGGKAALSPKLLKALEEGKVSETKILESANRIISTARRLNTKRHAPYDKDKHHEEAVKIAESGAVLLKNNSMLPLKSNNNYLILGEFADKPRFQGGGSSHINAYKVDSFLEHLDTKYTYLSNLDNVILEDEVAKYDGVIVFAGIEEKEESEGFDRKHLNISNKDLNIIDQVSKYTDKITVILMHGSVINIPFINEVDACLSMQLGGEGVLKAVANILNGKVSPSGRLNETYPLHLENAPCYINSKNLKDADYNEGVFVGYRYYETKKIPVLFPFGYGLSYSNFSYSDFKLVKEENYIKVSVKIKNIGNMKASEVVQLYMYPPITNVDRPVCELKGIDKVLLDINEEKEVEIKVDINELAYYQQKFIIDSGTYKFAFNKNSHESIISGEIDIIGDDKPLIIDEATTIGELFDNSGTREVVIKMLSGYQMNAEGDAISSEMKKAMLDNAPLRLLKSMAKMSDEDFIKFKENLQKLVK